MTFFRTLAVVLTMAVTVANVVGVRADEEALQTPEGIAVKVVAKMPTALYREPKDSAANEPLDAFSFLFVLPAKDGAQEKTVDGFYRVARTSPAKAAAGWVREQDFVEWPHAQVVGFASSASRERVLFFGTREDAIAYCRGDSNAESKAISREPAARQQALFPLLNVESTTDTSGETVEIYQLAYLSGSSANSATQPSTVQVRATTEKPKAMSRGEKIPQNLEELRKSFVLQIAFVVDTTASMQQWIDGMKRVIAEVVNQVQRIPGLKGRVEFAIIGFRDQLANPEDQKQIEYVTRILSELTSDHAAFQVRLAAVTVSAIGSEDHPEDGLAGIVSAIHDLNWSKSGFKHIIFISDAPVQDDADSYKNALKQTIPGVLALAQPTTATAAFDRIQIHGLRIVSAMPDETLRDFESITAGRDLAGLHSAYASEGDEVKFIEQLTQTLGQFADLTNQVVKGDFDQIQQQANLAAPGSDLQKRLGPVVEMLRAVGAETGSTKATTFEQGYACVIDREGNRCLEPHVLVSQLQLKLFASAVEHCILSLETAGDPGNRNVAKVVQNLQVMATGVNLKEDVHPDMPLPDLLSRILGIPVRNPVFNITPAKLAAMTSADFEGWKQQVKVSQSICESHLSNGVIWFALGNGTNPKVNDLNAFIKVSDLP